MVNVLRSDAGNTAIDGATSAIRLGASNVKMLYRRTEVEMTAYEFEYEFAKQDGVQFEWLTAPVKIIGDEAGQVIGIEMYQNEAWRAWRRWSTKTSTSGRVRACH